MANRNQSKAAPEVETVDVDEWNALWDEKERLEAENAELRAKLDTAPPVYKPRFEMSEGVRAELELTGEAVDAVTGDKWVGTKGQADQSGATRVPGRKS